MLGLVGTKKGMTRVFKDDGRSIPVTVVEVFNSKIVQRKTQESDGYFAIQVSYGKRKKVSKSNEKKFKDNGTDNGYLTEFNLSEDEFIKRAELQIECLNSALSNVDVEQTRMHICWGNYEGPHTHDIALEKILPIILKSKIKYFLIESSNPRHAHEWKVFQDIKLPKDKVLVPGVIDSTSNFVEHPEVVADRLIQFSTVISKDQLMAGTDCGFSTFAGFGKIDEKICYEKLHALVEGTKLASKVI